VNSERKRSAKMNYLSPSQPGVRSEVLKVLREWLTEANDLSYHFGGTYASVLGEALERLEDREKEGDEASS
jgi:hypothetical protein